MTTGGAPAHAGLAVGRGRECGRSLLVTPRRGGLRARQAHSAALRCQGGTRQQSRDNDAQHKTHDAAPFSVFTLTHKGMFRMQRRRGRSSTHHVGVMKAINRQRSGVMALPIAITFSVAITSNLCTPCARTEAMVTEPAAVGRPQTGRLVGRTARTIQISKHAPMNPAIR
jgi:hypothetical protein